MKKVIAAMVVMFLLIGWPGAGIWSIFSKILGGGVAETYIYPIYGGIILLAGLIVGCTVVTLGEIKSLKEELKNIKDTSSEK
ncbi:MAG: hypothetical protein ACOX5F_04500 [Anaerovoracaceae bacterium]|jgi:hypothetical protein